MPNWPLSLARRYEETLRRLYAEGRNPFLESIEASCAALYAKHYGTTTETKAPEPLPDGLDRTTEEVSDPDAND